MSYLSDIVRAATGRGIGENVGAAIGGAIGGPGGAVIGSKIGGATTRAIDPDRQQQGTATAVDVAPEPPREKSDSGESGRQVRQNVNIQPAVYTVPSVPGAGMGTTQAGLPAIVGGGTAVARGIGGMLMLGGGAITVAPIIMDQFGNEKKLRVTRRLRSQVKRAVEMFGVELVAEQMGTTPDVVFYILTKKMRNDGPYVTKAAVRKTRQTVRKMKHLCDMYDDLRPAAKRRAPVRRMASTKITNVK